MNTQPNLPTTATAYNIEMPQSVQNFGNNISESVNNLTDSVKSSLDGFSQSAETGMDASSGFLSSNTIIAKFVFLMLIIIVFIILLNLGILAIQYFTNPAGSSPYLIDGTFSGKQQETIKQDPKEADSILIKRSNNESSGIEFSWSTWIQIDELNVGEKHQHIFHKGVNEFDSNGIAKINNAPGLYIKNLSTGNSTNTATLKLIMSTTSNNTDFIEIDDIPLKHWVNIVVRMKNTTLDVYVNGTVAGRLNLQQVPLQNYYDVHIGQNNGFDGKISNLRYYDYALNIFEINKVVAAGPNPNAAKESQKLQDNYFYLSPSWFTAKI
tara:strand:- start:462 stop:1433 length:972 start_codon:yes stop_codon:yes gene_type:complete